MIFLRKERAFEVTWETFFLVSQVLFFKPMKQTSKNVVGTTFKACARYFSLFLKDKCISSLVRTKYIKKKFNLQLFFLPTVSRTFILSCATTRYPPPWNFLLRKNNCVIETMLVTLPLVQMNKARREMNQTNQVQTTINTVNNLQTSVKHLIPSSSCHWISNRMRYFFKKYLLVETFSSDN